MKLFQLLVASGLVISAAMLYAQPPPQPSPPVQVVPGAPTTGGVPGTPGTLPGGFGNVSAPVNPSLPGTGASSGSITGPTFVPAGRNLNPPPPGSVPPTVAPGVNPGASAPGQK
jgi:hypothetical protein